MADPGLSGEGDRVDRFSRDGLTFDVRDAGPADGEPVVLLHGFPQDSRAWDGVAPVLHGAGLRTLAPDQRGYSPGARPRGRVAYRLRTLVDDVLRLLDTAGLDRAHVVGHDWGAAVGWAMAAWHPDRVRGLTALSVPHPGAMTRAVVSSDQALRSWYMAAFQLPLLPERLLLAGAGAPLRRVLRHGGLPAELADHYVARMRDPGALTAALNWYRALPWSGGDPVRRVRVPAQLIWGAEETFLGRSGVERTADFCRGPYRLEVLEEHAHWLPELAADRVAELVVAQVRSA